MVCFIPNKGNQAFLHQGLGISAHQSGINGGQLDDFLRSYGLEIVDEIEDAPLVEAQIAAPGQGAGGLGVEFDDEA